MTGSSPHTYTFDLPVRVGEGDGADTCHVKVEAEFDFIPDPKPAMLNVSEARIVDGQKLDEEFATLLELTQDYLDGDGYDAAVAFARDNQPWMDWE